MRITAVYPNALDSTSFYRGAGPFSHLEKHHPDLKISTPPGLGWADMARADVLFLQRPSSAHVVAAAKMALRMNVPVWIDWDDDPFHVPISNQAFETYAMKETRQAVIDCLNCANVVSVSTPSLATVMSEAGAKNVVVVPNALDDRFMVPPPERPKVNNAVLWRGSMTHVDDLGTVTRQYRETIQQFPEWLFGFFGYLPPEIICESRLTTFGNVRVRGMSDIFVYFNAIRSFAPAIATFPLIDDTFNRCKSNIAWLETTCAGAVMLAPEIPEYQRPGIVTYRTAPEFREKLGDMIRGEYDLNALWNESATCIRNTLCLATVNQKRIEILRGLTR